MYADKDSRGLISVFEMDRPEWSALRGACQAAIKLWQIQMIEFVDKPVTELDTWQIQRKCHLEQSIKFARKLDYEIKQADGMVSDEIPQGVFGKQNEGEAIDIFNL